MREVRCSFFIFKVLYTINYIVNQIREDTFMKILALNLLKKYFSKRLRILLYDYILRYLFFKKPQYNWEIILGVFNINLSYILVYNKNFYEWLDAVSKIFR